VIQVALLPRAKRHAGTVGAMWLDEKRAADTVGAMWLDEKLEAR
jgi:hypothetical protein